MRRFAAFIAALLMILPLVCSADETDTLPFTIRAAEEETNKIALTIDDCYDLERVKDAVDLCNKYGITMTFFPLGTVLHPEDRELWQSVLDAGCEIGSHSYTHTSLPKLDSWSIISAMGRTQQALDATLGYHYEIRWIRPPYGLLAPSDGSASSDKVVAALRKYGFKHAVKWNVSQTDPSKAVWQIKPGCIALYHARTKDIRCLDTIIPQLLEKGYEPVTLSELLGFPPAETSDKMYVFDKKDFQ